MKKIAFIVFFIFLQSCGPQEGRWEKLPVKINAKSDVELKVLSFYNNLFHGVTFFEVSSDDEAEIKIRYEEPNEKLSVCDDTNCIGYTSIKWDENGFITSADIKITNRLENDVMLIPTFAHELMHSLGRLEHDKTGLMAQGWTSIKLKLGFGENLREWMKSTYGLSQLATFEELEN